MADGKELAGLMANIVQLIVDVAKNKGLEESAIGDLNDKLKNLESGLGSILDNIEEIKEKTLPKREEYPIEDQQKEQIYLQCLAILDKKIQEHSNIAFPEYNYIRFTVLDKDDYGNITGGELVVNTQILVGDNMLEFLCTFDIAKGYILEPMYVEYHNKKISFEDINALFEESLEYSDEYADSKERRTFMELPMTKGHNVEDDRPEQKNYSFFKFREHDNTKIPAMVNKYLKTQQEPLARNQGLIGS